MTLATQGILQRTFPIRTCRGPATGFTTVAGRIQYLITAAHMIEDKSEKLQIFFDETWNEFLIPVVHKTLDIAVIPLHFAEQDSEPVTAGTNGVILGEEVQFFGFPISLPWDISELPHSDRRSIPVVKRGIIAAMFSGGAVSGGNFDMVLDAVAWPGYSGSPIVVSRPNESESKVKVIGIVTGLSYPNAPVSDDGDHSLVRAGFVQACQIDSALDLMKRHSGTAQ